MSAFSPVDPRDPMNRRKQLIQKLMQQYQQKVGGAAVPAIGGHPIHAGGRTAPRPRIAGNSNVPSSLFARLGPGGAGLPLPDEMSPGPGMAAPAHGPPAFVNPGGPNAAPAAPTGATDAPGPPTAAAAPSGPPPGHAGALAALVSPVPAPQPGGGVSALTQLAPASLVLPQLAPAGSHFIPLGGGAYYDPITDSVHGTGGRFVGA